MSYIITGQPTSGIVARILRRLSADHLLTWHISSQCAGYITSSYQAKVLQAPGAREHGVLNRYRVPIEVPSRFRIGARELLAEIRQTQRHHRIKPGSQSHDPVRDHAGCDFLRRLGW